MTKNYSRDFEDLTNLQPSELKKSVLSVFGGKPGGIGSKKWVIEIAAVVRKEVPAVSGQPSSLTCTHTSTIFTPDL